jgi:hypothetical protein
LPRILTPDDACTGSRDPEGHGIPQILGTLYFVNPTLMDPARRPWFAALKRTARIGAHPFTTHYRPGENHGPLAPRFLVLIRVSPDFP